MRKPQPNQELIDWVAEDELEEEERARFETRHERDRQALQHKSCVVFPAVDPQTDRRSVRLFVFNLTHHRAFEILIVLLIFGNCISLALDDPLKPANEKQYLEDLEYFFTACFTMELLLKVYAQGLLLHPGAYLQTGWNRLDAMIVVFSFLTLLPNVSSLRALRVLRTLKSIHGIQGLQNIVRGLLHSLQKLVNVLGLAAFVFSIFGILGVQLWSGAFTTRCERIDPANVCVVPEVENFCCIPPTGDGVFTAAFVESVVSERGAGASLDMWSAATMFDEPFLINTPPLPPGAIPLHEPPVEANTSDPRYLPPGFCCFFNPVANGSCATMQHNPCGCYTENSMGNPSNVDFGRFCTMGPSKLSGISFGHGCDEGHHCVDTYTNPNSGFTNFDHFGYAVLIVFQCLTLEGWVDIMYIVEDVSSDLGAIYFILLVLLGSYFVLNLALAVINEEFDKIAKESEALQHARLERMQRRQERALFILLHDAKVQQQILGGGVATPRFTDPRYSRDSGLRLFADPTTPRIIDEGMMLCDASVNSDLRHSGVMQSRPTTVGAVGRLNRPASQKHMSIEDRASSSNQQRYNSFRSAHALKSYQSLRMQKRFSLPQEEKFGGGATSPRHGSVPSATPSPRRHSFGRRTSSCHHSGGRASTATTAESGGGGDEPPEGPAVQGAVPLPPLDILPGIPSPRSDARRVSRLAISSSGASEEAGAPPPPLVPPAGADDVEESAAPKAPPLSGALLLSSSMKGTKRTAVFVDTEPDMEASAPLPGGEGPAAAAEGPGERLPSPDGAAKGKRGRDAFFPPQPVAVEGDLGCWDRVRHKWGHLRWTCWRVITHTWFTPVIIFFIVLNTCLLASEHHQQPQRLSDALEMMNYFLTGIFAVEMIVKVVASGVRGYLRDPFNVLDGAVVVFSVLEIMFFSGANSLSVFRAFRLLRVFKLLKNFRELRELVEVILAAVSDTGYLSVIILLYIFCAALVGMQLFGGVLRFPCDSPTDASLPASTAWGIQQGVAVKTTCESSIPRSTFDSFYWSVITVFQVLTRDDWVDVMWNSMRAKSPEYATYYLVLVVCGDFVILNLFLAILIQSFDQNMRIETAESSEGDSSDSDELLHEEEPPPPPPEESEPGTPRGLPRPEAGVALKSRRLSVEEANVVMNNAEMLIKAGIDLDVLVGQMDMTHSEGGPDLVLEKVKGKKSFRHMPGSHGSHLSLRSNRSVRTIQPSMRSKAADHSNANFLSLDYAPVPEAVSDKSSSHADSDNSNSNEDCSSLGSQALSRPSTAGSRGALSNASPSRRVLRNLSHKGMAVPHLQLGGLQRDSDSSADDSDPMCVAGISEVCSTGSPLSPAHSLRMSPRHASSGEMLPKACGEQVAVMEDVRDVGGMGPPCGDDGFSSPRSNRNFVMEDYDHCLRCNEPSQLNTIESKKKHAEVHNRVCTVVQVRKVRENRMQLILSEARRLAEGHAPWTTKSVELLLSDAWEVGLWLDKASGNFEQLDCTIAFRKVPVGDAAVADGGQTEPGSPPDYQAAKKVVSNSSTAMPRSAARQEKLTTSEIGLVIQDTVVTGLDERSSAYKAGLRVGDVLISINENSVVNDERGIELVDDGVTGELMSIRVKRLRNWSILEWLCQEELEKLALCAGEEVFGGALVAFVNGNRIKTYNTNGGHSLMVFGPDNAVRVMVYRMVKSPYFERFILLCILMSSILMASERPGENRSQATFALDVFFTMIFVLEMLLKVVAFGLFFGSSDPDPPYLRDQWNILDGAIVILAGISLLISSSNFGLLKILRAFRALRPLRVISRNRGLRMVVITLLRSISSIGNVAIITFIVFLVFGILGVQLLKGKMHECNDPAITYRLACNGYFLDSEDAWMPRTWRPAKFGNFDHIGVAMLTLFEVATLELWSKIMYQSIDAVSYDQAPQRDHNPWLGLFYVVFVVIGSFFILNLFVGFVIFNFAKVKAEEDGTGSMGVTAEQKLWLETQTMMLNFKPMVKMQAGTGKYRQFLHKVTTSTQFEIAISVCIVLNVMVMGLDTRSDDPNWAFALEFSNFLFSAVFFVEALMKGIAFGKSYLKDPWNRFDFALVLLSILQVLLLVLQQNVIKFRSYILRIFRVFRILRILRLVKRAGDVRILLETISYSLPHIANIGAFLCLLFFIYAVLGVNLFSNIKYGDYLNRHANFDSFPRALLVLIRIVTGENWNGIMHETMVQEPDCSEEQDTCGFTAAPLYYLSFLIMATFVLTNLFVAIILDNFRTTILIEKSNLRMTDLHQFIVIWANFDPDATCHIPTSKLPFLLEAIGPPLGIHSHDSRIDVLNRTKSYCIPEHGGVIHFIETLIPLARQVLVSDQKMHYMELRNQEGKWRQAFPDINDLPLLRFRQRRCTADQYFSSTYIAAAYRRSVTMREYSVQIDFVRRQRHAWRLLYMPEILTDEEKRKYGGGDAGSDSSGDAQQVLTLPTEFAPPRANNLLSKHSSSG